MPKQQNGHPYTHALWCSSGCSSESAQPLAGSHTSHPPYCPRFEPLLGTPGRVVLSTLLVWVTTARMPRTLCAQAYMSAASSSWGGPAAPHAWNTVQTQLRCCRTPACCKVPRQWTPSLLQQMPLRWRTRPTLPPMPPGATGPSAHTGHLPPFGDYDDLDDGGTTYGIDGAGYQHGDVFCHAECSRQPGHRGPLAYGSKPPLESWPSGHQRATRRLRSRASLCRDRQTPPLRHLPHRRRLQRHVVWF